MVAALRRKACGNSGTISLSRPAANRFILILTLGLTFLSLLGAEPTSQPSQPIATVRKWFDQLADSDPEVRDKAVENLMGLKAQDLPNLRKVVEQSRPIRPSQRSVLHDVVMQVYLSDLPYDADPEKSPFLGFRGSAGDPPDGMVVVMRVPGFSAYRMLRDGDIVKSIVEIPDAQFADSTTFGIAIRGYHPGQALTLVVMRNGQQIQVPVELRVRPIASVDPQGVEPWIEERRSSADEYWEKEFKPAIGDEVSSAAGN